MSSPREILQERLERLIHTEARLQGHLRNDDGRRPELLVDWADALHSEEVVAGLDAATVAEARRVAAALGRLASGTYGICMRCGDDIAPGRLAAVPEAEYCVRCAE